MNRAMNPAGVVKPASNYAQAVVHPAGAERIVVSGQVGVRPDGTIADGLEGQMTQAWANVLACLADAGFKRTDLVKATIYVTQPGQVAVYRRARDAAMQGHLCANTYLEIAGLAAPQFLVEIEAEAVKG